MQFKQLPVAYNQAGNLRTVGFELEFANLTVDESVKIIQELFGGTIIRESRFKQQVSGTRIGDFTAEFDLTLVTEKRYKKLFETFNIKLDSIKLGDSNLEEELETALEGITGKIFPNEISCPPVAYTNLHELEKLRETLYQRHAEGTQDFLTNAFGTHINVEAPDLSAETLLRYLRAFILLYPWLLEVGKTDFARKVSHFIDPFPEEYLKMILRPTYKPDLETFITDYHTYNPDRNRPLDLYPLFAALQQDLPVKFAGLGKVKPRHTFHYRLPNSSISQPTWTLAEEWNNWVAIEELANDPKKIQKWSDAYLVMLENTLLGFEAKWQQQVSTWLS